MTGHDAGFSSHFCQCKSRVTAPKSIHILNSLVHRGSKAHDFKRTNISITGWRTETMKNVAALHGFLQCFITALLLPCELYPNRRPRRPVCEKSSYCPPYYRHYRESPSLFCVAEVPPVLILLQRHASSQGDGKRFRQCSIKRTVSGLRPTV